jgi:hypothetical protein
MIACMRMRMQTDVSRTRHASTKNLPIVQYGYVSRVLITPASQKIFLQMIWGMLPPLPAIRADVLTQISNLVLVQNVFICRTDHVPERPDVIDFGTGHFLQRSSYNREF